MPDFEMAHQAAEALDALHLGLDIVHLANGLEMKQPNTELTLMRAKELRTKLSRAQKLTSQLIAVLTD